MSLFPSVTGPDRQIEGSERDTLDAYWTPLSCARACCEALRDQTRVFPGTVLEPSVGGGAWVLAARQTWPAVQVDAIDIDSAAPGLALADAHVVGDFRRLPPMVYGLVLGNRPYGDDLVEWVELARRCAPRVAFLERATILGSLARSEWWERNPPTDVWVLAPRPKWGGPGARTATDTADSVLVLWQADRPVAGVATRLHWLRWSP